MIGAVTIFSSCSKNDDKDPTPEEVVDPYEVAGTTWSESSSYSGGYASGTYLRFSSTTATLQISYTEGTQTLTTTYNFTYRRSKNLVVLQPKEDDIATLEGRIDESGIKMTITNTSNGSVVTTLYKQ